MTPAALQATLARREHVEHPALPGRRNDRRAGVLVPLVWDPEPVVLLTLRAASLGRHAGEISFPGGKPEPDDLDLEATARREAEEELGLRGARVLGRLSSMPLYTSEFRLEPFVAEVPIQTLVPDPGEVARVIRVRLSEALSAERIEGVAYELNGQRLLSPVFDLDGVVMFGATAHTFHELLEACAQSWGRSLPPVREGQRTWSELL